MNNTIEKHADALKNILKKDIDKAKTNEALDVAEQLACETAYLLAQSIIKEHEDNLVFPNVSKPANYLYKENPIWGDKTGQISMDSIRKERNNTSDMAIGCRNRMCITSDADEFVQVYEGLLYHIHRTVSLTRHIKGLRPLEIKAPTWRSIPLSTTHYL